MSTLLNRPWLVLGAGALVIGGIVAAQNLKPGQPIFGQYNTANLRPAGLNTGVDMTTLKSLDSTFAALSEAAAQGVVFITSIENKSSNDPMAQLRGQKSGSGFVYRADGWIVTNDHVVAGEEKVKVVLADGRELTGRVVHANDPQLDLAVVKVDQGGLPTLGLADSSKVRVGQLALAIGAPFGLEDTVTIGHISALGRPGQIPDTSTGQWRVYSGLIQTDASINPGNSGGPLINVDGDVIGVNSAINSPNGTSAGIGFAIPSNIVKAVADELVATGKFDRGMLGVNPRDLKPYEKKKFNLPGGAYAINVEPTSAAYKAGIRNDDIVTAIDGTQVTGEVDLRIAMYKSAPKKSSQVTFVRAGQSKTVTVTLEAPKTEPVTRRPNNNNPGSPFGQLPDRFFEQQPDTNEPDPRETPRQGKPKLGVMVQQIDATAKQQFNLPNDAKGIVVATVNSGSFAQKVDLKPGDVITEINGKAVTTVAELSEAMAGVTWGDSITLKFTRYAGGSKSSYSVSVPFE